MQEKRKEKKRKRKSKEKNQQKPQVVREFEIILSAYWYIKGYVKCKTPWHWLQFLSGGNILYPFTKVGLLSTERAVVSDKHRQDCWQERFLTRVQFVRTSKTVISYHPVWVRWCRVWNAILPVPWTRNARLTVKTVADSSSLELPNEWRLLLPATGTKAPLSINSSETQPNFPDTQGCPLKSRTLQVQPMGTSWRYMWTN